MIDVEHSSLVDEQKKGMIDVEHSALVHETRQKEMNSMHWATCNKESND